VSLRLRPLRIDDEREALAAHAELERDSFAFLLGWEPGSDWPEYVRVMAERRHGRCLSGRLVPASFLVADLGGALVGRVSIRHELNDFLLNEGGHVGYAVRPGWRRRGYASEILRQSLTIARAEGVERVLVTCDEGNAASIAVIERAGGTLQDVREGEDGLLKRRYWID